MWRTGSKTILWQTHNKMPIKGLIDDGSLCQEYPALMQYKQLPFKGVGLENSSQDSSV
jgi:hypothetical protein